MTPGANEFPLLGGARFIGASVDRVEDPRLLTGEAEFVADLRLPRMASACFVRATEPHARIVSIDTGPALALPGVVAVVTARDFEAKPLDLAMEFVPGLARTPQPALARDKVRFLGEPVAVVVAESRYAAEDAAEQVAVVYERLEAVVDPQRAARDDAPLLFEELGTNVLFDRTESDGDVEGAFAAADRVFKQTYRANRFVACPMEGRGVVADYRRRGGQLTVWSSTQTPHLLRATLADVLAFPEHRLRVIVPQVGGGFGQKMSTYPEEVAIAAASIAVGRPVAGVEDRRENLMAASHAKEQVITLEAAVAADGTVLGMRAEHVGDAGAYSINSTGALIEPSVGARNLPGVFRFQAFEWRIVSVVTNRSPIGPYRAVGSTAGSSARDLLFAHIARELEIDVADFLRRNMIRSDELPFRMPTGQVYDSGSYLESMERALEMAGYPAFRRRQAEARREGRLLGIGIAPFVEATGRGTELSRMQGEEIPSHDNASVSVDQSGKVTVATTMASQGQGHETAFGQLAADILGVDLDDVAVIEGDTGRTPFGLGTWASRSAVIGGGSTILAAIAVRDKVLHVAGRLLEADVADLTVGDGRVSVAGAPHRSLAFAEVAAAAHWDLSVRDADDGHVLSASRFYDPPATFSNGCFVAVVEVDPELGTVRIERIFGVEDCGRIVNPKIVTGQGQGAVGQAVGGALLEHMVYDDNGFLLSSTLMDYLLPTSLDVPPIDMDHIETPALHAVGGIKGIGEGGLMSAPGAILCAVIDALEPYAAVAERLPLTPDRVLELMGRLEPAAAAA